MGSLWGVCVWEGSWGQPVGAAFPCHFLGPALPTFQKG